MVGFFNSNGIQGSNPGRRSNYCKVLPSATQQISADMHPLFFASCDIYPSDGRLMLIAELPRAPNIGNDFSELHCGGNWPRLRDR